MQNVSPEQLANLVQGATPVQIVILILLGAAVLAALILIVINLIKLYTTPMQKELDEAKGHREILKQIQIDLAKISKSLWSKDEITEKIQSGINVHALNCPFRNTKGKD